ncbi:hypothetical protein [Lactobacillus sp. Sy-1]|uniref:hypothetical protein n=1 Tax=Lactobacillus sp. Sy-1 TaxID=2109645 RepID=UPI001C5AD15D|nr:hypothetical protein [Lactobacillus sp. Sy-1]MBW1606356.1 hypothetical protein [Lactobacillus sp. Sy-1]
MISSKIKAITISTIIAIVGFAGGVKWIVESQNVHATQTVVQQLSIPATATVDQQKYVAKAVNNNQVQYQDSDSNLKAADYQVINSENPHTASNQYHNLKMPIKFDGQSTTLSDGTKSTIQGAMGHVYVQWQRGNWTVTTVSSPEVAKNPKAAVKQANQVNKLIKESQVTDHSIDRGSIVIDQDSQGDNESQISWQKGKQTVNTTGQNAELITKVAEQGLSK